MPVVHFITHQVTKAGPQDGANVSLTEKAPVVDDYANRAMAQLRNIYIGRAGKRYGEFHQEAPQVKALVLDWLEGKQTFEGFSQAMVKLFAQQLDQSPLEMEGHLAFFAEEIADGERFYIFHLKERVNVALNSHGEFTETRFVDFSNTGFGVCLNTTALKANESKYLSFSYGRGEKALQNAFCEAIGFTDTLNVEEETQVFLNIVNEYTKDMSEDHAKETRSKVVDYCLEQDKYGAPVEFKALSQELNEREPERFEKFVMEKKAELRQPETQSEPSAEEVEIRREFIPDRKSLRNYVRFSGKSKDVTLSFSANALGGDVEFNGGNNTLVIRNLPARLLKQLQQEQAFLSELKAKGE